MKKQLIFKIKKKTHYFRNIKYYIHIILSYSSLKSKSTKHFFLFPVYLVLPYVYKKNWKICNLFNAIKNYDEINFKNNYIRLNPKKFSQMIICTLIRK